VGSVKDKENKNMNQFHDLTGREFGQLKVIERVEKPKNFKSKGVYWLCKCVCGEIKKVDVYRVTSGRVQSCGCIRKKPEYELRKAYKDISRRYWGSLYSNAKSRNLDFFVSAEDGWNQFIKQNGKCRFTGVLLEFVNDHNYTNQTASLDRIDSDKGYILDNIQWIHKDINWLKTNLPDEEFIKLCCMVADHCRNQKEETP
jgi:hypothetical protein